MTFADAEQRGHFLNGVFLPVDGHDGALAKF
jgi:hypothetical protein